MANAFSSVSLNLTPFLMKTPNMMDIPAFRFHLAIAGVACVLLSPISLTACQPTSSSHSPKAWRTLTAFGQHTNHHQPTVHTTPQDRSSTPNDSIDLRAVTYNIKHGEGMDGQVDLARDAKVLQTLQPDFVALQEVDELAKRSGRVNQAAELGKQLDMHPAFGPFMDFQGGRYGLAILSRFPIQQVHTLTLPVGNEPRVALAIEVQLPNDAPVMIVNVHFDWVEQDTFRFAQATKVAEYLQSLTIPYVLLGDFNDGPQSRTLALFREKALEATKPPEDHFTFSSTKPEQEIDFIFAAPTKAWSILQTRVIDEPLASDHRPVLSAMRYHPNSANSP